MSAKKFYAETTFILCGKCAANCHGEAISMVDGRPVWKKGNRLKCCACINRCPVSAIQCSRKTVSRSRYVNPVMKQKIVLRYCHERHSPACD